MDDPSDDRSPLERRLDELERRVATLEREPAVAPAVPADPGDPFWILRGIEERPLPGGTVTYAGSVETGDGPVRWQVGYPGERLVDADWGAFAPSLVALASPVRLALLQAVLGGQRTVGELGALDGAGTTGQLYHHLRQLVAQNWLRQTGRGRYEVPVERVVPLLVILAAATEVP